MSRAVVHTLESRRLLATVTFTGNAPAPFDQSLWAVPQNWSTSSVPSALDDVIIPATVAAPVIQVGSGVYSARSVDSEKPITIFGGTLRVGTGAEITGNLSITENSTAGVAGRLEQLDGSATGFALNVSGDLTLTSGGVISMDGRGFGSDGPGSSADTPGDRPSGGGTYGGQGGANGSRNLWGGLVYGSVLEPTDRGSGGGAVATGPASRGGGALRLVVGGTLSNGGVVSANGTNGGSQNNVGGGSGGSVWVTAGSLAGTGIFMADGGGAGFNSFGGGGGGGRVAVYYDSSTYSGTYQARGGPGVFDGERGGAGTVFVKAGATRGTVTLDNNNGAGNYTDFGLEANLDANLVVRGGAILGPHRDVGIMQLTLSGNMTVQASGSVQALARGFASDGPGSSVDTAGDFPSGGGSHGGQGGANGSRNLWGGLVYGSVLEPNDRGSGGGAVGTGPATRGGGAVRLIIGGALANSGIISANGGTGGSQNNVGGGSGGSVWVTTGTLSGAGTFAADGGPAGFNSFGGGGGGGRVAVYYSTSTFTGTYQARGGAGVFDGERGGAGTVYVKAGSIRGTITLDNNGSVGNYTDFGSAATLDANLVVRNGAVLGPHRDVGEMQLTLSGNMTVAASGSVQAFARGFASDGPGSSADVLSGDNGGASYGGQGGANNGRDRFGALSYGSAFEPADKGSGGGSVGTNAASRGGGAIRLTIAGSLVNGGVISANGGNGGSQTNVGGGSGGSVWIRVGTLSGAGTFTADGGSPGFNSFGGGGGGGRVAVYYNTSTFTGGYQARGGPPVFGGERGGAGTVFVKAAATRGTITLDNGGSEGNYTDFGPAATLDANLIVRNSAILGPHRDVGVLQLAVTGNVTIETLGAVRADARGSRADQGAGSSAQSATTTAGAGYGGVGGMASSGLAGGGTYGSAVQPTALGSGSGTPASSTGATGGGAIRIQAGGNLVVNGPVSATGGVGGSRAGGGSGGSVWLIGNQISGIGQITANGGGGRDGGGGGGAGRIAVYASAGPTTPTYAAVGGAGNQAGANGTIFVDYGTTPTTATLALIAASDTGASDTDGITRLQDVTFGGSTVPNVPLALLIDGVQVVGSATSNGQGAYTISVTGLAPGTRTVQLVQTGGGPIQPRSQPVTIVIDTTAPTLVGPITFSFETSPFGVAAGFSENVSASLGTSDVAIQFGGSVGVPSQSVMYDPITNRAVFTLPTDSPIGDYTATLVTSGIADLAGNALMGAGASTSFFVLAGDANRDRVVNFADLVILAQNYGQSGRTFSQGNFDYSPDGVVGFADLVLLAQRYGTSLVPLMSAGAAAGAGRKGTGSVREDVLGR